MSAQDSAIIMGMPVALTIRDDAASDSDVAAVFNLLRGIDKRMSPFQPTSEVSRLAAGTIPWTEISAELTEILDLAEETNQETNGYFDITRPDGRIDPSGIVKGWAIHQAAEQLGSLGFQHFLLDVGGDIATAGSDDDGEE